MTRNIIIDTDPWPGRCPRHPSGLRQPGTGSPRSDRCRRQRAARLDRGERHGRSASWPAALTREVFAGADRPLMRTAAPPRNMCMRKDGPRRSADLPEPAMPLQEQHAVDFIIETLRDGATGKCYPLRAGPTHQHCPSPDPRSGTWHPGSSEIVLMGGGFFEGGNITPTAEFNIYVDPQAAQVVLRSGVPVDHPAARRDPQGFDHRQARRPFPRNGNEGPAMPPSPFSSSSSGSTRRKYGRDGGPLHDPNVIAYVTEAGALPAAGTATSPSTRTNELDARHDRRRLVGGHRPSEERTSISATSTM